MDAEILKTKVAEMVRSMSDNELFDLVGPKLSNLMTEQPEPEPQNTKPIRKPSKKKTKKRKNFKKQTDNTIEFNDSDVHVPIVMDAEFETPKTETTSTLPKKVSDEALTKKIVSYVKKRKGVSVSQVSNQVQADKTKVASILKSLVEKGEIARGGERRFCRYAETKEIAENASLAARGKKK